MADTEQVLNLAAIIREVDGSNNKGAAALAESILDHPRFRAALADEPAVPEGREPVSIVEQPSDEEVEVLADQLGLVRGHANHPCGFWIDDGDAGALARAVLARWGNPAPQPPAKGEVAELVEWLREQAEHELGSTFDADYFSEDPAARNLNRAADLLQRLSPPQPVPVSERLPAMVTDGLRVAGDCDAEGRCWWLHVGEDGVGDWLQRAPYPSVTSYAFFRITHWLPAQALPVPEVNV